MHRDWIKRDGPSVETAVRTSSVDSIPPSPAILAPDGEGRRRDSIVTDQENKHKTSASYASTNSSFLSKHFPKRIFILKSLTTVGTIRDFRL